jgi:hypothetical protein
MHFHEAVAAVEAMVGDDVEVEIWGLDDDAAYVGALAGVLSRVSGAGDPLPPVSAAALRGASRAETFRIGEDWANVVSLWPERFISAEWIEAPRRLEFRTKDATLRIGPRSLPLGVTSAAEVGFARLRRKRLPRGPARDRHGSAAQAEPDLAAFLTCSGS